jgi:hypothetical protein
VFSPSLQHEGDLYFHKDFNGKNREILCKHYFNSDISAQLIIFIIFLVVYYSLGLWILILIILVNGILIIRAVLGKKYCCQRFRDIDTRSEYNNPILRLNEIIKSKQGDINE